MTLKAIEVVVINYFKTLKINCYNILQLTQTWHKRLLSKTMKKYFHKLRNTRVVITNIDPSDLISSLEK